MLPAFPASQKILTDAFMKRVLAARAQIIPPAIQPPVREIVEGKRSDFQREDRQIKPLDMKFQHVDATFDTTGGKGMTLEVFEGKAREIGEDLGKQMWELLFNAVNEAVKETGNILQIRGGQFTKEDFIRMLEMSDQNFDEKGDPTNFMILHPNMAEKLKKLELEWNQDEVFKSRVTEVKNRKMEEFHEREARRRLVE